jgi:hypothetical protein
MMEVSMNTVLDQVRREYEQMSFLDLLMEMERQGFDPAVELTEPVSCRSVVDFLMAVEENCAFH